jgi:AmmeMemoRadiSam system protein A
MRESLLRIASSAIAAGLAAGRIGRPDRTTWRAELAVPGASFVTLTNPRAGLRGCRGTLEPLRALGDDVHCNAFASAFDDPRFPAVSADEVTNLEVEIAVLGPLERLEVSDEAELSRRLSPGHDGVVLTAGDRRATFLPKVWELLPDPQEFLAELKRKAGLPQPFWSPAVRIEVYRTQCFRGTFFH